MKDEKLTRFIVNIHPVKQEKIEVSEKPTGYVCFGGAYVSVYAHENASIGTIANMAVNYFKPFCEVKATEVRNTGYSGPV